MTYESLLSDLQTVFEYFMEMLQKFITSVSQYPFIMLGIFLLISFPVLLLIFDFIISLISSGEDITTEGFRIFKAFKLRENKKKMKAQREAFDREKINKQKRAYEIAQTFFENNPNRMSISIMGFKFYQDGFENKNWSNSKKTRVTKKYKLDSNGEMIHSGTTVTSTESYDNTSDLQLLNNFDVD